MIAVVPTYAGDLELIGISKVKETMEGPGRKLLTEAKAIADREGMHILTNLEQGEPYSRIVHVAEDENCDLIVMGRRGRTNLERELMGRVTARVIGHTHKDVLVVPEGTDLTWDKILLATKVGTSCTNAEQKACALGMERGSSITAITVVYTTDEFITLPTKTVHALLDKAKENLQLLADRVSTAGIELTTAVKEGEPHQAITSLARELAASLIVMGSHGKKGLGRLLMGSVTRRTIGYAPCPVLIVH